MTEIKAASLESIAAKRGDAGGFAKLLGYLLQVWVRPVAMAKRYEGQGWRMGVFGLLVSIAALFLSNLVFGLWENGVGYSSEFEVLFNGQMSDKLKILLVLMIGWLVSISILGGLLFGLSVLIAPLRGEVVRYGTSVWMTFERLCLAGPGFLGVWILGCVPNLWLEAIKNAYWEAATSAGDAMTAYPWYLRETDTISGWFVVMAWVWGLVMLFRVVSYDARWWDGKTGVGVRTLWPKQCNGCGYLLYDFPKIVGCPECGAAHEREMMTPKQVRYWEGVKMSWRSPNRLIDRTRLYDPQSARRVKMLLWRAVMTSGLVGLLCGLHWVMELGPRIVDDRGYAVTQEHVWGFVFGDWLYAVDGGMAIWLLLNGLMPIVGVLLVTYAVAMGVWGLGRNKLGRNTVYLSFICGCYVSWVYLIGVLWLPIAMGLIWVSWKAGLELNHLFYVWSTMVMWLTVLCAAVWMQWRLMKRAVLVGA
ncbi:hypothetical protein KS4_07490 [Poriferisphaera corsica]|uniref:Yip1 domain-containing protein n=1 Tax=Poriferisphaera corsica TaxID=2528020 RepID=A0A517YR52_9BACT|nr:hypothetical protein [Poriferisphaera corsica]QDU32715.1 hypothetical protein KS4_07490 [Poriferisphaera corsica]